MRKHPLVHGSFTARPRGCGWPLRVVALALAVIPAAATADPAPLSVTFTLDPKRFDQVYECDVTTSLHRKDVKVAGSVRPTPGSQYPTINVGRYKVSLGLHYRKENLMRDPVLLTAAEYDAIKNSKRAFGPTSKQFLVKYAKQPDGRYKLPESENAARAWMRKVLTIASPANDALILETAPGKPRLALVLENDEDKVPVTRPVPGSDERKAGTAGLVHVHSGPDAKRAAEGCLTVPVKDWPTFLKPILDAYPSADDWIANGYVGKGVGTLVVGVKQGP